MFFVVLNLIYQYTIININFICFVNIFHILLCNLLCAILIFKNRFENLTYKRKYIIFITNINIDLAWINLEIYKYILDLNVVVSFIPDLIFNLLFSTFLLSTYTYNIYMNIITKIKTTCKQAKKKEKKVIF